MTKRIFKTSAARFHEHLIDYPLRLGLKKTKHDPDLKWWTSHHIMSIYLLMRMTFFFGARIPWKS
jgi:hypothetical protein